MLRHDEPLQIGKTDRYGVKVGADWLDGEVLTGVTATVSAEATLASAQVDGDTLTALFTGVSTGWATVDWEYQTATRTKCVKTQIRVVAGC